MNEIRIEDLGFFDDFLTSVCKVTGACKFKINTDGCEVDLKNDSETFKAFFKTKVLRSEEPVEFCLDDIRKLLQSIKTIVDYRNKKIDRFINKHKIGGKLKDGKTRIGLVQEFRAKETPYKLMYERPFVKFNRDGIKFKFSTIKESLIAHTLGRKTTIQMTPIYGCTISSAIIKKLCSLSSIASLAKPKVYMYKETKNGVDYIIGEIDDKTEPMSDSIAYPLTQKFTGDWLTPICIKIELFTLFSLVESDEIQIFMTDKNSITVSSQNEFTTVHIIAQGLKK